MNFAERRKQVFEKMERQSALILFSGIESHVSADEYAPFEADRNFFYLTGLRRDHMIFLPNQLSFFLHNIYPLLCILFL